MVFFRHATDQIVLPIRQFKGPIEALAFVAIVETDANNRRIIITNGLGNLKRSPAKLRNRASSAAVLVLDSKPINSPGFKESCGYVGTCGMIAPVVNNQLLIEEDSNP